MVKFLLVIGDKLKESANNTISAGCPIFRKRSGSDHNELIRKFQPAGKTMLWTRL